jgi:hypothetical protein
LLLCGIGSNLICIRSERQLILSYKFAGFGVEVPGPEYARAASSSFSSAAMIQLRLKFRGRAAQSVDIAGNGDHAAPQGSPAPPFIIFLYGKAAFSASHVHRDSRRKQERLYMFLSVLFLKCNFL